MADLPQVFATGLSLTGLVLNVARRRSCFVVWLGSNLLWATWAADRSAWGMVITQIAFAVVGVVGFVKWGKTETDTRKETCHVESR